uniref:Uncharacterized protein n=1 Tax=viral metagenome TaxID=1070528 RepID=A0A6M3LVV8_9ZZZZ
MESLTQQIENDLDLIISDLIQQSDLNYNLQKAIRLKRIGFINSIETKILKKNKINEDTILLPFKAKYYREKYPFLKFITEIELKKICRKYNLISAPIYNYVGTIPDKNLMEIENTQLLLKADNPLKRWFIKILEFDKNLPAKIKKYFKDWVEYEGKIEGWDKRRAQGESDCESLSLLIRGKLRMEIWFVSWEDIIKEANLTELYICAPKNNFVISRELIKEDGNSYYCSTFNNKESLKEKCTIVKYTDPIVFRYCRDGVQIISKWGEEANGVVNDIEN